MKTPKLPFAVISFAGIGLTMTPMVKIVPQGLVLAVLFLAIGSAIVVAVAVLQDVLASRKYFGFEGVKYLSGLLVPLVAYYARKLALDDVNAIFRIDPGPLPMTLSAAMVVNLMVPLLYAFAFASLPSIWFLFKSSWVQAAKDSEGQPKGPPLKWWMIRPDVAVPQFIAFAILFASMIGGLVANYQLNEDGRRRLLYMVAMSTDFNSKFACDGIKMAKGMDALFIGPDQRKVLLAAEFDDAQNPHGPVAFAGDVPRKYPVLDCVAPKVDLADWMAKNHLTPIVEPDELAKPDAQPKTEVPAKPAAAADKSKTEAAGKSSAAPALSAKH